MTKPKRLRKVASELGVGIGTIVDFLEKKGIAMESNPNAKIESDAYQLLLEEYSDEKHIREESRQAGAQKTIKEVITLDDAETPARKKPDDTLTIKNMENVSGAVLTPKIEKKAPKVVGKLDIEKKSKEKQPEEKKIEEDIPPVEYPPKAPAEKNIPKKRPEPEMIETKVEKLTGPKVLDKIELPKEPSKKKLVASSGDPDVASGKRKRKRMLKEASDSKKHGKGKKKKVSKAQKAELSEEEIQKQIKETLARLSGGKKSKSSKYRRDKRAAIREATEEETRQIEEDKKVLQVTEFVTANELANMMDVHVNEVISACMTLGLFVSINQRMDAETMNIVAEEFGYQLKFVTEDIEAGEEEDEDHVEDLEPRAPIVTVMGHVDHGKTSLLDYIRKTNVIAGEAGGITQHIGAYNVLLRDDRRITFLDTPGHEAFTAMRARGAQITDIAVIVIAADDDIMPQTVEAINHAQAADVPMVFAINKIDKDGADPEKIKEALSAKNILVEDWGGKFQSQDISAKKGTNVDELMEKILLEAELLELKANPNRNAKGTVIESTLDKGRGYVTTILVQNGTLNKGDFVVSGSLFGRIKAMQDERGNEIEKAGPSTPVSALGFSNAATAGDPFVVYDDEHEAKAVANKREQLQREQGIRTQKHITLDEIGRRLVIGDFRELNIIVKGDVDGSIEAIADSLLKLSTEKIQVNVIHKSVGQILESDVLLATASDAIIVGFQVRPSPGARKLAEKEEIDIRLYSVIYDAIDEIKAAMEGLLAPSVEEKVVANIEVREVYKITKVGTVAGCYVLDGKINRNTKIRVVRDGIVAYTGELGSLKRFKDDVKEVATGYECGLNIANFNDIKVGDIIEGYEEIEVKQKL